MRRIHCYYYTHQEDINDNEQTNEQECWKERKSKGTGSGHRALYS